MHLTADDTVFSPHSLICYKSPNRPLVSLKIEICMLLHLFVCLVMAIYVKKVCTLSLKMRNCCISMENTQWTEQIATSMVSKMMLKKEKQLFIDTQKAEEEGTRSKWRADFRLTEQIWQLILISLHYLSDTLRKVHTYTHTLSHTDRKIIR